MNRAGYSFAAVSFVLVTAVVIRPAVAAADERTELAEKIIEDVEALTRGKASKGVMKMIVQNPRWKRTMTMKFWEVVKDDRMLVKITAPAEDAGTGSLKLGRDLWSYNPHIDQIQKIPASLMLDSWMGSDFTNDDITRDSSMKDDYDVIKVEDAELDGMKTYRLTLKPKPDSPVVWDLIVLEVLVDDHRPVKQEYFDEKGKLARVMFFLDYKKLPDGRNLAHRMKMESKQEENRYTEIVTESIEFMDTLPKRIFSIRALKKGGR